LTPKKLHEGSVKALAASRGIVMKGNKEIADEFAVSSAKRYGYSLDQIKSNFDSLIVEMERELHDVYNDYERKFATAAIKSFIDYTIEQDRPKIDEVGATIAKRYKLLDDFFLSMSQSRKSRAGHAFEYIHNWLFNKLGYPFDEQAPIDGKPDYVMPSTKHYEEVPVDCIIFTAKRTVRERWRQIVTEGQKAMGFYLATIDTNISENALRDMARNKINVVVPKSIKDEFYADAKNVFSFSQFFRDKLDPALEVWRRNGVA
jgi:hypothetical protein